MKRLVALMMCAVSLGAAAQSTITYPYNPDGNADALIGVTDLQDMLSVYGGAFSPSEIQIDGVGLGEVLTQLLTTQAEMQASILALEAENLAQAELITELQNSSGGGIEGLENYLSVDELNNTVLISGANLQVVSGEGLTDAPVNGTGNIIIGYDENTSDDKSGSHNLVVGRGHTYSSYGGFVAGQDNSITGNYTSISGGANNTASGYQSSVSGGYDNTASGYQSSVSGGHNNTAEGFHSSVLGGNNTASGIDSSVSGGANNDASGDDSSVSGGRSNTASGEASSVSGGNINTASEELSSVSGGEFNAASGYLSSVSGGAYNTAASAGSSVSGGLYNTAEGFRTSVLGGYNNTASGYQSSVSGGYDNTAEGIRSSVSGGANNTAFGYASSVLGGANNTASGDDSSVSGDISYQEWVEEQGYLTTETDPVATASGYATQTWVEEQGYLTTETDPVATASGYATQTWVEEQGYSTVSGIEGLEEYLSVDDANKTVLISGANLQVVSGEGQQMQLSTEQGTSSLGMMKTPLMTSLALTTSL